MGMETTGRIHAVFEAKQITDETLNLVTQGNRRMEDMQESMGQINSTSQDVTKIIKVIEFAGKVAVKPEAATG